MRNEQKKKRRRKKRAHFIYCKYCVFILQRDWALPERPSEIPTNLSTRPKGNKSIIYPLCTSEWTVEMIIQLSSFAIITVARGRHFFAATSSVLASELSSQQVCFYHKSISYRSVIGAVSAAADALIVWASSSSFQLICALLKYHQEISFRSSTYCDQTELAIGSDLSPSLPFAPVELCWSSSYSWKIISIRRENKEVRWSELNLTPKVPYLLPYCCRY